MRNRLVIDTASEDRNQALIQTRKRSQRPWQGRLRSTFEGCRVLGQIGRNKRTAIYTGARSPRDVLWDLVRWRGRHGPRYVILS